MWSACGDLASEPDTAAGYRKLAERVAGIIGAGPVAIVCRDVAPWRLVAQSGRPEAGLTSLPSMSHLDAARETFAIGRPLINGQQRTWTPIPLDDLAPPRALMLLPGDWSFTPAAAWLGRFAQTAALALRVASEQAALKRAEGVTALTYSISRKLSLLSGERAVQQFVVDAATTTANADFGGLAVYRPKEGALAIAATHGYPHDAVRSVRIDPGVGIIGSVFSSKKAMLVRNVARVPGLTGQRPRYKTGSFIAVPILAGTEAVGVLTLADRRDRQAFDRVDLTMTRVVCTLASLALVREQQAQQIEELAHLVAIDPLTGLFNRRYLHTRLDAELERSSRMHSPVALVMADVDNFKSINDRLGHPAGDVVLQRISDIMRHSVRVSDVCTRFGGDEFAIIVSDNPDSAMQSAERIRHRVEAFRWDNAGLPPDMHVTVSLGVVLAGEGESGNDLIRRGDLALYDAKAAGRNCVRPVAL
jgi:diguanylate cyclase (GGDEF)-like protein